MFDWLFKTIGAVADSTLGAVGKVADAGLGAVGAVTDVSLNTTGTAIDAGMSIIDNGIQGVVKPTQAVVDAGVIYGLPAIKVAGQLMIGDMASQAITGIGGVVGSTAKVVDTINTVKDYAELPSTYLKAVGSLSHPDTGDESES
jgi:hypothetical protein